jgi:hypothetical protein
MVFPSPLIDDFAFLLMYIEEIEKRYGKLDIGITYKVIPKCGGYIALFKLHEVRSKRTEGLRPSK